MYGLTPTDLDLQRRAREFTDELIPYEVEAEDARRPAARRGRQDPPRAGDRARPLRHQHARVGRRPGLYDAAAGARAGAGRPGHQRRRLVPAHAAVVVARGRQRPPARDLAAADRARRDGGVLRHHRGGRRLRRRRPDGHRPPRGRRLRPRRREVARHVLQRGRLRLLPGRPDHRRRTPATRRCSSSTRTPPACASCARRRTRTRSATTTRSSPSRTSGCRPATWSAARRTACPSSTSGSASSG